VKKHHERHPLEAEVVQMCGWQRFPRTSALEPIFQRQSGPMNVCSIPPHMHRAIAVTVALMTCMGAPAAQAHLSGGSPPASNIDQIIRPSGYPSTGNTFCHDPVDLTVIERLGDPRRLLEQGRPVLYRQQGPNQSKQTAFLDGFFGRTDDVAPTPPTDFFETPRSKPQLKRLKPKHLPLAQPTAPSGDNKAMSLVTSAPGAASPALRDPANSPAVASKSWSLTSAPVTASSQPKIARKINDLPITPLE
jgi:hypothetical protein